MAVLCTASPYTVGPPFERLEIFVNFFLVIAPGRDRGEGKAMGHYFLFLIIIEEST
jgi:hypothetical protein